MDRSGRQALVEWLLAVAFLALGAAGTAAIFGAELRDLLAPAPAADGGGR